MKINFCSDLHLEFGDITLPNKNGARVLVLSGDILIASLLHDHPNKGTDNIYHESASINQRSAGRFRTFLKHVSEEYQDVIFVPGNHEFYHGKFPDAIKWLSDEFKNYKNIHLIENSHMEIDGIVFVGGTLWTNMNNRDPMTLQIVKDSMNDFNLVRNSDENYRKLHPVDVARHHAKTLGYIQDVVDSDPTKTYVVVGHHGPTPLSIPEIYKGDYHLNGAYASDLSEFIIPRPQIKLWTAGHTHFPHRYYVGDTLVACNPRGYIGYEPHAVNFTLKCVDLNNMIPKFDGVDWDWKL